MEGLDDISGGKLSELRHPVQDGQIKNWDQVEAILHHILYNKFSWKQLDESNVMWDLWL